jgi:hypothetical protein
MQAACCDLAFDARKVIFKRFKSFHAVALAMETATDSVEKL